MFRELLKQHGFSSLSSQVTERGMAVKMIYVGDPLEEHTAETSGRPHNR